MVVETKYEYLRMSDDRWPRELSIRSGCMGQHVNELGFCYDGDEEGIIWVPAGAAMIDENIHLHRVDNDLEDQRTRTEAEALRKLLTGIRDSVKGSPLEGIGWMNDLTGYLDDAVDLLRWVTTLDADSLVGDEGVDYLYPVPVELLEAQS